MISNIENPAEFLAAMREIETRDEAEPHALDADIQQVADNADWLLAAIGLEKSAAAIPVGGDEVLRMRLLVSAKIHRRAVEVYARCMSIIAQHEKLQSIQRGERSC